MKLLPIGAGGATKVTVTVPDGVDSLIGVLPAGRDANGNQIAIYISADQNETTANIESGVQLSLLCSSYGIFPPIPMLPGEKVYAYFSAKGSAILYFGEP